MKQLFALWLTGLPCSGKTTLAGELKKELQVRGLFAHVLDGDELRRTLSPDLGYSQNDRHTHIRRVADLARSFILSGVPVIVATISPYRTMRLEARNLIGPLFIEVYVRCPLAVCEARDVKGHYGRARRNEIAEFTGISSPFEEASGAEIVLDTDRMDVRECIKKMTEFLYEADDQKPAKKI